MLHDSCADIMKHTVYYKTFKCKLFIINIDVYVILTNLPKVKSHFS